MASQLKPNQESLVTVNHLLHKSEVPHTFSQAGSNKSDMLWKVLDTERLNGTAALVVPLSLIGWPGYVVG